MLVYRRLSDAESHRDAVARIAGHHGLADEALAAFDGYVRASGGDIEQSAWAALYDWDCLDLVDADAGSDAAAEGPAHENIPDGAYDDDEVVVAEHPEDCLDAALDTSVTTAAGT